MHYKNSVAFEEAIFGRCSGGHYLGYKSFEKSMTDLVVKTSDPYPDTRLGRLFFFGVFEELKRRGMNPDSLRLQSARGSRADIHHFVDGFFYLPSTTTNLVTIDLFNLGSRVCRSLKDQWDCPDESSFQTHLFNYKMGAAEFSKENGKKIEHWDRMFSSFNFSSRAGRPENHFVLTPYYTENRSCRKIFVNLVAGFLAKEARETGNENTALFSR